MLSTTYLGLELKNPLVPSSSPLCRHLDYLRFMEDAGAGAIVLHSLFEEEINAESRTLDQYLTMGAESYAEAVSYFPEMQAYQTVGPDAYLTHIQKAKSALDIPIIASLNGVSRGGWIRYAREIEQAGADALELNIYYIPTSFDLSSADVEQLYLDALGEVKANVSLPVAIKLSPYFSSLPHFVRRLVEAGADGLVLFNRFYQPDLDVAALEVVPNLKLSHSDELRLPLRWIAILYGRVEADFALTTGVHTIHDVLKGIAAGANITMMTSELLQNGIERITTLRQELQEWLHEYEYDSISQLRGSLSQINCPAPAAFERANYLNVVRSYKLEMLTNL